MDPPAMKMTVNVMASVDRGRVLRSAGLGLELAIVLGMCIELKCYTMWHPQGYP